MKVLFEKEDLIIIEKENELVFINSNSCLPIEFWFIQEHEGRLNEILSKRFISEETFKEASVIIKKFYQYKLI